MDSYIDPYGIPRAYRAPTGARSRPVPPTKRGNGPPVDRGGYDRVIAEWMELVVPRYARLQRERLDREQEIDSVMRTLPYEEWAEAHDPGQRVLADIRACGSTRKHPPTADEPREGVIDPRPDDLAGPPAGSKDMNDAGLLVTEGDQTAKHRRWTELGGEAGPKADFLSKGGWSVEQPLEEIDVAKEIADAVKEFGISAGAVSGQDMEWIAEHRLKRAQVERRELQLATDADAHLGQATEILTAIRAGRHRDGRQRAIIDRIAAFILEQKPNLAALARHIGCNRDTLYTIKQRGEEMTVIERINALEERISEQLDAQHRQMLAALGFDSVSEAEEILADSVAEAA